VLRNNDRAAAAQFSERAAEARAEAAGTWDDPMLMAGVTGLPTSMDFSQEPMTMKMIALSQRFPWAGDRGLDRQAAVAKAAVARQDRYRVQLDLVTAAKVAYFDLYYRQKIVSDLGSQRALLEQVLASVRAKLTTNQARQEDVAAAQAELWRLDAMILSARQEVDAARYELQALMGSDFDLTIQVAEPPPFPEIAARPDAWESAARENYPPLKRLASTAESFAFSARAEDRRRWPALTLSAGYGQRDDGPMGPRDDMLSFQASFGLPIFSGGAHADRARAFDALRQGADLEARQLWRDVVADLKTLHVRAQRLSEELELYRGRIIPIADDAFKGTLSGYEANRTSLVALLTYGTAIYRDRIAADRVANRLARVLAQAERYTTDPRPWSAASSTPEAGS